MDTWIRNDSLGRYLYAKVPSKEECFENSMARTISSANIIPSGLVYQDEVMCYEWNISGFDDLKKYFEKMQWKVTDITTLLFQIHQAVNTVKNYLLSEGDIVLEFSRIFIDPEIHEYKFCVIPGYGGDFEASLKKLIYEILINLNSEDTDSLRLGFQLLKASADPEFKLHDMLEVIKRSQQSQFIMDEKADRIPWRKADFEKDEIRKDEADKSGWIKEYRTSEEQNERQYYHQPIMTEQEYINEYRSSGPNEEISAEGNGETKEQKVFWGRLAISQGVLIFAVLLVFLLKGKELVLRLLPIYLILAVCISACYLAEFVFIRMRRKKTA